MDWSELYLFLLIFMRVTGFVMFSPILGRNNLPNAVKAGMIMVFSVFVAGIARSRPQVPATVLEFAVELLLELAVGFVPGFIMQLFFMVVQVGGEVIDNQMGLTMAQVYDAGSQVNMTVTASLLNVLLVLNFFAENGHYTLLRMFLSSEQVIAFGQAHFGQDLASAAAQTFITCITLEAKLALPILAAELLGELGMGILMKAIPQINAFVINMELKVIIGLVLLFVFLTPLSEFLLGVETQMLDTMEQMMALMGS